MKVDKLFEIDFKEKEDAVQIKLVLESAGYGVDFEELRPITKYYKGGFYRLKTYKCFNE